MSPTDPTRTADEQRSGAETTRRTALRAATERSRSPVQVTRRGAMARAAGLGLATLGAGATATGVATADDHAGGIAEFEALTVGDDNRIVDESGEPFVMRGLSLPDPRRVHRTRHLRGKTPTQIVDLVTNDEGGWYPTVIRLPAQPQDIVPHPMGFTGPEYAEDELESPDAVRDDRRKVRPPQPPAFEEDDVERYLERHYDPVVERCRERGVYCVVDFHRHWHEQPPGEEPPFYSENHLPYDSEYTNYWAYNDHDAFGTDAPASWWYVDGTYTTEHAPDCDDGWPCVREESEVPGTPYAYEHWQVNEPLREEALRFWRVAARRYGDEPHVILEPYNEPAAPGIWGPVEGCGGFLQRGLWRTFQDDFLGPILDEIRRHYDRLLLASVPGWCRSVQALHWRNFREAGYENVAVTWHTDPNDPVSQQHNWLNDTEYRSPAGVEDETGEPLEDATRPVPEGVGEQACWGWEPHEYGGLQDAVDHHPVVVSEFGWEPVYTHVWVDPRPYHNDTTNEYGLPFLDAMESDPRISWIASFADARWTPRLFEYPDGPEEGDLDLVGDNFYDTDFEELPAPCEQPPCEWYLLGGEDSGEHLKERLAEHRDDHVPFETEVVGPGRVCEVEHLATGVEPEEGTRVCDLDGDGRHRDFNADGSVTQADVTEFFSVQHRDAYDRDEFDFNENGSVGLDDVVSLFREL